MKNNRFAKRVYGGVCAGSCSVGRQRKRRIDTVGHCTGDESLTLTR